MSAVSLRCRQVGETEPALMTRTRLTRTRARQNMTAVYTRKVGQVQAATKLRWHHTWSLPRIARAPPLLAQQPTLEPLYNPNTTLHHSYVEHLRVFAPKFDDGQCDAPARTVRLAFRCAVAYMLVTMKCNEQHECHGWGRGARC